VSEEAKLHPREAPEWAFWAVLALLAIAPGQLAHAVDPKHGPFIAYADVLAAVVVAAWGLWALATGRLRQLPWPPRQTWALLAVAVLAGIGAESLKMAAIIQLALYFVLAYMLFAEVLRGERRQRIALLVLLAGTSVAILHGLAQYATAADPEGVRATFQSRTAYSAFLVMVLPLFYGVLLRSQRLWERVWAGIALVAGALTILSPGLLWVLALVLGVMTAVWGARSRLWAYVAATVLFCVVTIGWLPLNRQVHQELLNPYEEGDIHKLMDAGTVLAEGQPIVKKRWIEWLPALNMMAENFLLGVGTGNYQLNIGRPEYYGFLPNVKKSEADTNNLYLVTAGSMGFAGLVALLAFLGHFLGRAVNLRRDAESQEATVWAAGLYGLALAIPLVNVFSSLFVRGTALVWALGLALIVVLGSRPWEGSPEPDQAIIHRALESPPTEL